MARLYSPTGVLIDGLLETCPCRAIIDNDEITQNEDGTYEVVYAGGSDMFWDDQRTVERDITNGGGVMERVFLDEDGGEWLESQLVLRESEED